MYRDPETKTAEALSSLKPHTGYAQDLRAIKRFRNRAKTYEYCKSKRPWAYPQNGPRNTK